VSSAAKPELVEQSFRFVLAPVREQAPALDCWLGASRYWFNAGLAEVKDRLDRRAAGEEDVDLPWSYKRLCSVLNAAWRNERAPWQAELPCGTYMAGFEALGAALMNFSEGRKTGRRVGFPDFKRKGQCSESVFFQKPRVLDARWVEFTCAQGPVRTKERMTKLLRLLERDEQARITRATITRRGRHYYVSFTVKRSRALKLRHPKLPSHVVGADVGLARQATLSTGQVFANLRPLQANLRRLRRLQRHLDRQRRANNPGNYLPDGRVKPGARDWAKSRRMLETERLIARLHERIADQRRHAAHHLTTFLTRRYGVIGAETLNVKGMLANKRLARHISDVGWGLILKQLKYKTGWSEGSILALPDRFYPSSKKCSACGSVKTKLDLSERVFACDACGCVQDRDVNAGLNLAHVAETEAKVQGRTGLVIVTPPTARVGRGATDLEKRRSRRGSQATATNRALLNSPENRRAA
jgi:putative transposase